METETITGLETHSLSETKQIGEWLDEIVKTGKAYKKGRYILIVQHSSKVPVYVGHLALRLKDYLTDYSTRYGILRSGKDFQVMVNNFSNLDRWNTLNYSEGTEIGILLYSPLRDRDKQTLMELQIRISQAKGKFIFLEKKELTFYF